MEDDGDAYERSSAAPVIAPVRPRKLAKVPFVELAGGRLQGVVSSGSDPARVYVSSVTAGEHGLSCSTNNNRPCGGLTGSYPCKHVDALLEAAVAQYGVDRVARYLRVDPPGDGGNLRAALRTTRAPGDPAGVFAGFLRHLAYLELAPDTAPLPDLQWFPAAPAVR